MSELNTNYNEIKTTWNYIENILNYIRSSKSKFNVSLKYPCHFIITVNSARLNELINFNLNITKDIEEMFNIKKVLYEVLTDEDIDKISFSLILLHDKIE